MHRYCGRPTVWERASWSDARASSWAGTSPASQYVWPPWSLPPSARFFKLIAIFIHLPPPSLNCSTFWPFTLCTRVSASFTFWPSLTGGDIFCGGGGNAQLGQLEKLLGVLSEEQRLGTLFGYSHGPPIVLGEVTTSRSASSSVAYTKQNKNLWLTMQTLASSDPASAAPNTTHSLKKDEPVAAIHNYPFLVTHPSTHSTHTTTLCSLHSPWHTFANINQSLSFLSENRKISCS